MNKMLGINLFRIVKRKRYEVLEQYEKHLKYNKQELLEFQKQELSKLLQHAVTHSEYYKDKVGLSKLSILADDPYKVLDLFPILTKEEINRNFQRIITVDQKFGKMITTGGATGHPTTIFKSFQEIEYQRGVWLRNHMLCNYDGNKPFIWLWGGDHERRFYNSIKGKLKEIMNNEIFLDSFAMDFNNIRNYLDIIKHQNNYFIYGYATSLLLLANYILENNIKVENASGIISTAEVLRNRNTIEKAFNAKVFNQYGCREVLSIAEECIEGNMHISADSVFLEFKGEGNSKKILITSLKSFSFPLIRYEVGDFGNSIDGDCKCGCILPLMNMSIGRISDNFMLPKGEIVHGEYFTHLMYGIPNITSFQFHQKEKDTIFLYYVPQKEFDETDRKRIQELVERVTHQFEGVKLIARATDCIPPTKNGKHRFTISDVLTF